MPLLYKARMTNEPRSGLNQKTLIFLGFCFVSHPLKKNWQVQICVYKIVKSDNNYVIATSEMQKGDVWLAQQGLGKEVPGALIAPYAARRLEGIPLVEFKKLMEENTPGKWYWSKEVVG